MVMEKLMEVRDSRDVLVKEPSNIVPLLREFFENAEKEIFAVVALNAQMKVISVRAISVGTVNRSLTHTREIYRHAILENATAIIVSHNHPSGVTTPSEEDVKTTRVLYKASDIIGIKMLDHIIIGDDYFSFMEHEMLEEKS